MNLGISIPETNQPASRMISYEEIIAMQLENDDFFDHVSAALKASQGLMKTFSDVLDIMKTLKKHNYSQESLAVMNDLFRRDFGGNLSEESLAETGKKLLEKLKGLKDKIGKAIRWLLDKIGGLISSIAKFAKSLPSKAAAAFKGKPPTGTFESFDLTVVDDYVKFTDKFVNAGFGAISAEQVNEELNAYTSKFTLKTVTWTGQNEFLGYTDAITNRLGQINAAIKKLNAAHETAINKVVINVDTTSIDAVKKSVDDMEAALKVENVYTVLLNHLQAVAKALSKSSTSLITSWNQHKTKK